MSGGLADEFLADLDDDEDVGEQEEVTVKQEQEDEEMVDDDLDMEVKEEEETPEEKAKARELEDKLKATLKNEDITKVATLLSSSKFKNLMKRVEEKTANSAVIEIVGPIEEDPEYMLIVESNALVAEIHNEIVVVHKYIRDRYAKKFPELESLVQNPLDYARVVKRIANISDLAAVDLTDLIPAASIMIVSVAASTTGGGKLEEAEWLKIAKGCDIALELDKCRKTILEYVESRMIYIAPNLSSIVGSSVAAKLVAAAGGLSSLSKIPACNLILLGAPKRNLAGLSTANSKRFMQGYIFEADVVQKTPPSYRSKVIRVLGPKTTVAARIDSNNGDKTGDTGRRLKDEIKRKVDKWQEAPPPKEAKPLPAPDDRPRKVRMTAQEKGVLKKQKQLEKNQQKVAPGFATSGFTTSLSFTPVQGLELADPAAAAAAARKVQQANERYFSGGGAFFQNKKQRTGETPAPN